MEHCFDCEGRGYVPDEGGEIQACGECDGHGQDDDAAGRAYAADLARSDAYAVRVSRALGWPLS